MQIYIILIPLIISINTQNKHSNKYKLTTIYDFSFASLAVTQDSAPRGRTRLLASACTARPSCPAPVPRCGEDGITNNVHMYMHAGGITNTHDQIWQEEYTHIYAVCICTCVLYVFFFFYIKLKYPTQIERERERKGERGNGYVFFPYVFLIPNSSSFPPSLPHFATPSIYTTSFSTHFSQNPRSPFSFSPSLTLSSSIPIRCVRPRPFPPLAYRNEIPILQLTGHRILHMYYVKRDPPQGIMLNWKSHLVGPPLPSRQILAARSGTLRKGTLMTSCWLRTFVEYFLSSRGSVNMTFNECIFSASKKRENKQWQFFFKTSSNSV